MGTTPERTALISRHDDMMRRFDCLIRERGADKEKFDTVHPDTYSAIKAEKEKLDAEFDAMFFGENP